MFLLYLYASPPYVPPVLVTVAIPWFLPQFIPPGVHTSVAFAQMLDTCLLMLGALMQGGLAASLVAGGTATAGWLVLDALFGNGPGHTVNRWMRALLLSGAGLLLACLVVGGLALLTTKIRLRRTVGARIVAVALALSLCGVTANALAEFPHLAARQQMPVATRPPYVPPSAVLAFQDPLTSPQSWQNRPTSALGTTCQFCAGRVPGPGDPAADR